MRKSAPPPPPTLDMLAPAALLPTDCDELASTDPASPLLVVVLVAPALVCCPEPGVGIVAPPSDAGLPLLELPPAETSTPSSTLRAVTTPVNGATTRSKLTS